jgi:hypothetical protein
VRPLLTDTDRVVLTLVYLRQHCSQKVLAELLEINPHSIGEAIADTRQLLDEHGHTTSPTTTRFTTVAALSRFLTTGAVPTARPRVPALLSDPSLTGMPRTHLASLIERLSVCQAVSTSTSTRPASFRRSAAASTTSRDNDVSRIRPNGVTYGVVRVPPEVLIPSFDVLAAITPNTYSVCGSASASTTA